MLPSISNLIISTFHMISYRVKNLDFTRFFIFYFSPNIIIFRIFLVKFWSNQNKKSPTAVLPAREGCRGSRLTTLYKTRLRSVNTLEHSIPMQPHLLIAWYTLTTSCAHQHRRTIVIHAGIMANCAARMLSRRKTRGARLTRSKARTALSWTAITRTRRRLNWP